VAKLTDSGLAFNRTSTPAAWEKRSWTATLRSPKIRRRIVGALGGFAAMGLLSVASIYLYDGLRQPPGPVTTERQQAPSVRRPKEASPRPSKPTAPVFVRVSPDPPAAPQVRRPPPETRLPTALPLGVEPPSKPIEAGITKSGSVKTLIEPARSSRRGGSRTAPTPLDNKTGRRSKKALQDKAAVVISGEKTLSERTVKEVAPDKPAVKPPPQPAPAVVAERAVVVRNTVRAVVKVTIKCGGVTKSVNVLAKGETLATVPQQVCQVSCAGSGGPVCPGSLSATAGVLEIR
jgi:hypothetical protein